MRRVDRQSSQLAIFICMVSSRSCLRLHFAKDELKRKKKSIRSRPCRYVKLPLLKARNSLECRQGKTKRKTPQMAAEGWGNTMATVFEFQPLIPFCVADCIISVRCLGVDLLSDLWIQVSEPAVLSSNSQFFTICMLYAT